MFMLGSRGPARDGAGGKVGPKGDGTKGLGVRGLKGETPLMEDPQRCPTAKTKLPAAKKARKSHFVAILAG